MFFQSESFVNQFMPLTPIYSPKIWLALNKTWEKTFHLASNLFFNILRILNSIKH